PIVVYRRSWRDIFSDAGAKIQRAPKKANDLWKVSQLWKSDSVACGSFFFMISTNCLESTKRFPHFPPGPARAIIRNGNQESQKPLACSTDEGVQTLVPNTCPVAGFEVITIGRFWGDNRGHNLCFFRFCTNHRSNRRRKSVNKKGCN